MLELLRTILNPKGTKTQGELLACVAVMFVWISLLFFVAYSLCDTESVWVYVTIPIAVGALGIAATVAVFAFVVGQWEEAARRKNKAETIAQRKVVEAQKPKQEQTAFSGLLYKDNYKSTASPIEEDSKEPLLEPVDDDGAY
jgi:hypothetical protein